MKIGKLTIMANDGVKEDKFLPFYGETLWQAGPVDYKDLDKFRSYLKFRYRQGLRRVILNKSLFYQIKEELEKLAVNEEDEMYITI